MVIRGRAYDQNRGLDKNGDGSITKAEAAQKVNATPEFNVAMAKNQLMLDPDYNERSNTV